MFGRFETEARRLLEEGLLYPAYEFVLRCSHAFNLLDARGVLSHTERQAHVQRIRRMAEATAKVYLEQEAVKAEVGTGASAHARARDAAQSGQGSL